MTKVFHPDSRKAAQLARTHLQKSKRAEAAAKRTKKHAAQADVFGFFYHALPPEGVLTLDELHRIVREVWLTRHDDALAQARAARRRGRSKSAREATLEDMKRTEMEAYRTGIEVPDLTHAPTVQLFRKWDQKEIAYVQQLRFIRISSSDPAMAHQDMHVDDLLSEPPSRFASTITTMDGPL